MYFRGDPILGFRDALISEVSLFQDIRISRVSLFQCLYFKCGLVTVVSLFQKCPYFRGVLISGCHYEGLYC